MNQKLFIYFWHYLKLVFSSILPKISRKCSSTPLNAKFTIQFYFNATTDLYIISLGSCWLRLFGNPSWRAQILLLSLPLPILFLSFPSPWGPQVTLELSMGWHFSHFQRVCSVTSLYFCHYIGVVPSAKIWPSCPPFCFFFSRALSL